MANIYDAAHVGHWTLLTRVVSHSVSIKPGRYTSKNVIKETLGVLLGV